MISGLTGDFQSDWGKMQDIGIYTPTNLVELEFLYWQSIIVNMLHPNARILDCGTMQGGTALIFASGLIRAQKSHGNIGHIISVEIDHSNFDIAQSHVKTLELEEYITLLNQSDLRYLTNCKEKSFDIIYHDSLHTQEHLSQLLEVSIPAVTEFGWIGGHDYGLREPGVFQAVDAWRLSHKGELSGDGLYWSIWWNLRRKDENRVRL